MATIDSKKLLPSSKESSAIEKPKFLVPFKSISVKKITGSDLKPVDKVGTDEPGSLVVVKKKIVSLSKIINNNLLLDQKEASAKRKEGEKSKREKREKDLEQKVKKNNIKPDLIGSIPGQSIFDKINRFIGFTLLGYLFNQYGQLLPKLMEFGKVLEPVGKFVEGFAKNLLKGVVDFVEFGYKAYDQTRDFVKQIGGEGAQKTFDDFSKNLNLLLNGAIGAAMLIASTAPPKTTPKVGFDKIGRKIGQDTQKRYLERYGEKKFVERFGNKNLQKLATKKVTEGAAKGAAKQVATQGAKQSLKSLVAVPVIGSLIGFIIDTVVFREKPSRAAAGAVGSAIGQGIGIALAGGTTFGLGAGVGMFVGGFAGDWIGKALYDTIVSYKTEPLQAKAQGGTVTGSGQSTVTSSRKLKTRPKKTTPKIQSQKTQPGKDAGGKLRIEELYGKDEPGKRSALRALKKSSEDVKKMRSINGLTGAMFGAGIDMALGQKPDKKLARSIGDVFGSVIQNAVNAELSSSFGDISKTIAMASGGVVPTREIGSGLSIGERIGKFISSALAISIESSASRILQNLNRELNLEGGPPGGGPSGGGGDGASPSVSSDSADFWLLSLISLYENANPQGAADVAQSIYNRMGYSGRNARQIILARNQYQPVGKFGSVSEWNKVIDKETALAHIKKYPGNAASASGLEKVAAALLDKSMQQRSAKWIGNRPDFRSDGYESSNDEMTDDISRYGQTFGFNKGSAYKGKSPVAQRIPSLVKGTVDQLKPKGLPLTGENGRLKPSQLTRVGTLIGGVDYQDWYGNGAYLRNDAPAAFLAAKEQAKKEGIAIPITSAYRSLEHQRAIQGKYSVVAAPGTSRHGEGTALDIQTGTAGYSWFVQNGPTYGWRYMAIPGDPVHFEYVGGFTPSKKQNQVKLSPIFNRSQASLAPNQPTSTSVAFANNSTSKTDTSAKIITSAVAILPIEVSMESFA